MEADANAGRPRIVYVCTRDHFYTFRSPKTWLEDRGVAVAIADFERLLCCDALPPATYILTDFDRLSPTELTVMGHLYQRLSAAGLTVLNDPRRFCDRAGLIRRLRRAGLSDFDCWLPAHGERPDRYPVFLRTISGHRGVQGDLLTDAGAVEAALSAAAAEGLPESDLVLIEYAAEPHPETGRFQKRAGHRVGAAIVRGATVNDSDWIAKFGVEGGATAAQYAEERAEMEDDPWRETVAAVFDVAGMDYGRIDFGLVGGRPQIYELNTNPSVGGKLEHPNEDRVQTLKKLAAQLTDALAAIARPPGGPDISLDGLYQPGRYKPRIPRRL